MCGQEEDYGDLGRGWSSLWKPVPEAVSKPV